MLSEIAKDYKAKIEVSDTKSRTSKMVILSGDNTFMYNEFRGRLKQIMEGEVIEDIQVSQNCFEVMKERIRFLEKRIPNTKIDYDSRTERFSVYGRPEMKKVLGDALRGIYTELSLNSTVKVSLRGNGRSPGLLKALMTEYGAEMHKALPTKDAGTIQVILKSHCRRGSCAGTLQFETVSTSNLGQMEAIDLQCSNRTQVKRPIRTTAV